MLFFLTLGAGLSGQVRADQEKPQGKQILSAIEVAALMDKGESDADIAKKISEQRGVDRASSALKGKTDEQIIYQFLSRPKSSEKVVDKGKAITHKAQGETYEKSLQHDKAANEFSLAISHSTDDYDLYKLRGDSYKQYLTANLSPSPLTGQDEFKRTLFDRKRKLLCNSIYADYRMASGLVDKSIQNGVSEMNRLRDRMTELKDSKSPNDQYKKKSAENIISMRLMQRILYQQRAAKLAGININKAMADYKTVCAKEDAARRDVIRRERDATRDRKWMKYGEKNEATYFYDTSSPAKSKGSLTVWSRRETADDATSYDLAKLKLDCKNRSIGTLETSSYDENGKLALKKQFDTVSAKSVVPGSVEDLLLAKTCK
jgi:hypothetical protein